MWPRIAVAKFGFNNPPTTNPLNRIRSRRVGHSVSSIRVIGPCRRVRGMTVPQTPRHCGTEVRRPSADDLSPSVSTRWCKSKPNGMCKSSVLVHLSTAIQAKRDGCTRVQRCGNMCGHARGLTVWHESCITFCDRGASRGPGDESRSLTMEELFDDDGKPDDEG